MPYLLFRSSFSNVAYKYPHLAPDLGPTHNSHLVTHIRPVAFTSAMASRASTRKRSRVQRLSIDTPSVDDTQPDRRTRSMRKSISDDAPPRRARRPTVVSTTSSEDGDNVRLTKTGRVSKALKGQPVHQCHLCTKVCVSTVSSPPMPHCTH